MHAQYDQIDSVVPQGALSSMIGPGDYAEQGAVDCSVQSTRSTNPDEGQLKQFVSVVQASVEEAWKEVFRQNGRQYREPKRSEQDVSGTTGFFRNVVPGKNNQQRR